VSGKLGIPAWNSGLKMSPEQRTNMGRPKISDEQRIENLWSAQIKHKYGVTADQYNFMFVSQNGCCAICKTHQSELKRRLDVDHNHKTGKVRGLLCNPCNTTLGNIKDSTVTLETMISYLKKDG
jgi:uncharacterized secreted protein with C-terminal beta-propeller domain